MSFLEMTGIADFISRRIAWHFGLALSPLGRCMFGMLCFPARRVRDSLVRLCRLTPTAFKPRECRALDHYCDSPLTRPDSRSGLSPKRGSGTKPHGTPAIPGHDGPEARSLGLRPDTLPSNNGARDHWGSHRHGFRVSSRFASKRRSSHESSLARLCSNRGRELTEKPSAGLGAREQTNIVKALMICFPQRTPQRGA